MNVTGTVASIVYAFNRNAVQLEIGGSDTMRQLVEQGRKIRNSQLAMLLSILQRRIVVFHETSMLMHTEYVYPHRHQRLSHTEHFSCYQLTLASTDYVTAFVLVFKS